MCGRTMTIAKFVEHILETEIEGAGKWVNEHINAVGDRWQKYANLPITSESATSLVFGICARITVQIRSLVDIDLIVFAARAFLREIEQKALALEMVIDQDALNAIIVPKRH